jgi:hypothetical protein
MVDVHYNTTGCRTRCGRPIRIKEGGYSVYSAYAWRHANRNDVGPLSFRADDRDCTRCIIRLWDLCRGKSVQNTLQMTCEYGGTQGSNAFL